MTKKKVFLVCTIFLCAIVLSFVINYHTKPIDNVTEPTNYHMNEFDDALITYLCQSGYELSDFMISPTAFRAALCLAAAGAQGNTRAELLSAAGFSGMNALDAWYSSLNDSEAAFAARKLKDCTFSVANSIWSNKDLVSEFTDSYTSGVKLNYDAEVYSCKYNEMTQMVNDWIDQKTDGMITNIADDLTGASSALVNTLHLRTVWKNVFPEAATHEGVFVGISGKEQTMDFMEQTGEYLYVEESGTKAVVIPMEGNISFVCFLGSRIDRFDKITNLQMETVHVVLPKFELESAFYAGDLLGFLLSCGVRDAIDKKAASFYDMCEDDDWFIQEIMQKTKITTDEKGIGSTSTKAKADANGIKEDAQIKEFIADCPFSFAIFSDFCTDNQHMLLYGQLMNCDE